MNSDYRFGIYKLFWHIPKQFSKKDFSICTLKHLDDWVMLYFRLKWIIKMQLQFTAKIYLPFVLVDYEI
jgi:hypothetical protein